MTEIALLRATLCVQIYANPYYKPILSAINSFLRAKTGQFSFNYYSISISCLGPTPAHIYKTSTWAAIGGNNPINDYYEYLIQEKGDPEHNARHKACRKLAILSLGVFKSGKKYQPYRRDHVNGDKEGTSSL